MKVLLVIPKRDTFSILPAPDVGVAYVARAALNAGADVEVLDAHLDDIGPEELRLLLRKKAYDLIAFKCLSMDIYTVLQYCRVVKEYSRNIITLMGGPHPTALPENVMRSCDVDYIIRGEGEPGITGLIRVLLQFKGNIPTKELEKIPCLTYRDENSGAIRMNTVLFEQDIDKLGFPAWDLFRIDDYPQLPGSGGKFLPVITSRGCPSLCTFCSSNAIHGRNVRTRSPEHVIEEIKWILRDFRIGKVSIFDNNFTFYREHAVAFSELYIKNRFPVKFDVPQGVRLDRIDEKVILALDRAGCDYLGVGVESGSQETLNIVRKGTTLEMIREKLAMIREKSQMKIMGFFILGFPHETEEQLLETIDFSMSLPLDYAAFTIFTPFPGTELFNVMLNEGYFTVDSINWEDLVLDRPTFQHRKINMDRLKKLQRKAYLKFYLRPSKINFFIRIILREGNIRSYLKRLVSIFKS